jgi:hypothetical protein
MSLKAISEFVLHSEGFRNLDLFHQGLYHVRFTIYHEKNDQRIYAHPYHLREGAKKIEEKKKTNIYSIIPAHILDNQSAYCTRTFLIRFCDEEVDLNELCHFRTEFDAYPDFQNQEFILEGELMFSDLSSVAGIKDKKTDDPGADFKCVSVFKAKIIQSHLGIHEYVPVLFDEQHFCLTNLSVHSLLMDFRFRCGPHDVSRIEDIRKKEEKKKTEPVTPIVAKNFTEFLSLTTSQFRVEELDNFYAFFVKGLKKAYENMAEYYHLSLKLSLKEKTKDDLKIYVNEAPPVETLKSKLIATNNSLIEESKGSLPTQDSSEQQKPFSLSMNSSDPEVITKAMLQEVNTISGKSFQLWHLLLDMLLITARQVNLYHKEEYHKKTTERWGESIFQHIYKISDLTMTYEPKIGENHKTIAHARRNNIYYQNLEFYSHMEDINMFPKPDLHPIVFEEICLKEDEQSSSNTAKILETIEMSYATHTYVGTHLIVLVHGFQGNSFDMRLIKNNISYLYPDTLFLCSSANEDNTENEIEHMGEKLANEVRSYINDLLAASSMQGPRLGRLSFIGHSLGGLIIRAALPHLEEFSSKMHLYMSLSSPHLGYMYNSSKIIDAGIWILRKWKKSVSLTQLSMSDNEHLEDSYLYKLSTLKGLSWFKNIALVSSYQDQYAPFDSARIQICKRAMEDPQGKVYVQMAKNILSNVTAKCIYRIDVNFKLPQKNLDTMIGRAAHIQFLESQVFMRMLVYRYSNFFA